MLVEKTRKHVTAVVMQAGHADKTQTEPRREMIFVNVDVTHGETKSVHQAARIARTATKTVDTFFHHQKTLRSFGLTFRLTLQN